MKKFIIYSLVCLASSLLALFLGNKGFEVRWIIGFFTGIWAIYFIKSPVE